MNNDPEQFLIYSAVIAIGIAAITAFSRTASAAMVVFADKQDSYKFSKDKIPQCLLAVLALATITFGYGMVASGNLNLALQFCGLVTFFGGLSCFSVICYIRKK